jgi:transcriptional regulator
MYVPNYFAELDLAKLHEAMERYSFAMLVSGSGGEMVASHLPLLIERTSGQRGTLLGHMARANPQWKAAAGQEVLAIFSGPHVYVSPTWYEAEHVVPTWNYVAVHAYGRLEIMQDEVELKALLQRMVETYEASQPRPWSVADSSEYLDRLLPQIVGFRIPIARLEGKWKLNQNRPAEQRQRVIDVLCRQKDENSREVARLMRERFS